jgi:hypothetical protein
MKRRGASIFKWVFCLALICLFQLPMSEAVLAQSPFAEEFPTKTDLREAIFRYMFQHYDYGPNVKFFCIQPEKPQPEQFLRRFSKNEPRVVWNSDCETAPKTMNGLREKKTGQPAVRMTVSSLELINTYEAEAHVVAFSDGIAANWNILQMTRENGRWIVKRDVPNGVS